MRYRHYQIDMPHTLSTYFFLSYFHSTTITHDAFIADTLILTTSTLIVLHWAEDALTEETISLRLVGAVVDGFRLSHLSTRNGQDTLR